MVKNIVFDIGNVLLEFNPVKYFTKYFNDEAMAKTLCQAMLSGDTWNQYDLGVYSLEQVKTEVIKRCPQYHNEISEMLSIWVKILEPMETSLDMMRTLKNKGYRIYLLSNLNKEAYLYIDSHTSLFKEVDGYVVSFKEGMIKPDEAIYDCLCSRYGLNAEECLFIDDLKVNVDAAKHFGMQGIVFTSFDAVYKKINEVLEKY